MGKTPLAAPEPSSIVVPASLSRGASNSPPCLVLRVVFCDRGAGVEFGSFNILADEDVRAGLKVYSKHPTFPQVSSGRQGY